MAGYFQVGDWNRDGQVEMAYSTGSVLHMSTNPYRFEIGRFRPHNRFEVLHADTLIWPPPPGLQPGDFSLGAAGDPDRDGLAEFLGYNADWGDSAEYHTCIVAYEQRHPQDLPTTMTWHRGVTRYLTSPCFLALPGSLDGDSRDDFPCLDSENNPSGLLLENAGNDQHRVAWTAPYPISDWAIAFGDYDLDCLTEFAGGYAFWNGKTQVWKTTGDDEYDSVWAARVGWPNGHPDLFPGRDVNQNGRPEFFQTFMRYMVGSWKCYLYMWEANGAGGYNRTFVDSVFRMVEFLYGRSICTDLDGDGVEEIAWSTSRTVDIYKAHPDNRFERLCQWYNDHTQDVDATYVNAADVNYNGYNDLLVASAMKVSVLEVEAVRVLVPNRRQDFYPGDTCRISWQTFEPPRCDSVSLFLRRDSTFRLDTIATGLASADTPFVWIVPDVWAESARIMAIAYGPGWQYDESDTAFRVLGTPGIEEVSVPVVRELRLDIQPNPCRQRAMVSYDVPCTGPVELAVFDASGRRTALLASGAHDAGRYQARWSNAPAGIYYVLLRAEGRTVSRKVVVSREP